MLVLLAAMAAGALNAVVGAGTLITFPTLLALGVPPVVANVSNTVGLVPGSVAAAYGFRTALEGQARFTARLLAAAAGGGVIGAVLLLALPADAFEVVVPALLVLAGVLAAIQPRMAAAVARRRRSSVGNAYVPFRHSGVDLPLIVGVVATGVYGGYFGAAQGVILLALLGIFVEGSMSTVNGIKNVLAGTANFVSAVCFILVGDVDWRVAALVAIGASVGGGIGGRYGRRIPAGPLRLLVVAVGVVAAAWYVTD